MRGRPYNNIPVGGGKGSEVRKQTAACSFRMLPSTDKKWRWFTERSGHTPSAVANALVRDLVGERLEFRQDSAVLKIILESGLAEHYEGSDQPSYEV
ncbi:MAG TPA: hypothetical protein EYN66_10585 [Myxococcales bacterium]|nr:hypothetical protein [Myxococcales bacterium]